ncbi:hypothetical protein [Christiangramia sp.]|uniref:hypothetical protein n=1 Tax=Christiangramia sp. TaxID=1931228 RepID=UPI00263180B7|nr:hypothetical protein [Christiangramia sp.]
MDLIFIENRILFWKQKKDRLLKLKKSERGNGLKEADSIIARLTDWKNELSKPHNS